MMEVIEEPVPFGPDHPWLMEGDCLERMAEIADGSVDMICTDLPYATTSCAWDSLIPLVPLWEQYRRVLKPTGAIALTASQPFTTTLVSSNLPWFKYALVWVKSRATGHVHSKNKPMKRHEDVLIFSPGTTVHASQSATRMTYNPQGLIRKAKPTVRKNGGSADTVMSARPSHRDVLQEFENYPDSLLTFDSEGRTVHPTQKPLGLMEWLIASYTNAGETVLDNTMGSGTTGIACANLGRSFIGIEKDPAYFAIARDRIAAAITARTLIRGSAPSEDEPESEEAA